MIELSDSIDLLPEQIFKDIRSSLDKFTKNAACNFHHFSLRFCAYGSRPARQLHSNMIKAMPNCYCQN